MPSTAEPTVFDDRIDGMIAAIAQAQGTQHPTDDSRAPRVPPWLTRRFYRHVVSHLFHGEVASLELCERLATLIDDPRAHFPTLQIESFYHRNSDG